MSEEIQFASLRVSRAVYPQLFEELSQLSHRPRAERFRSLAFLGYLISKSRISITPVPLPIGPGLGKPDKDLVMPKVRIHPEAYPELTADLVSLLPRHRAERFRALANVGLMVMTGRFTVSIGEGIDSGMRDDVALQAPIEQGFQVRAGQESRDEAKSRIKSTEGPEYSEPGADENQIDEKEGDLGDESENKRLGMIRRLNFNT